MTKRQLPKFKRKRRRRAAEPKDVRCSVRIIVGGRTVKTVKRSLTWKAALREMGGDPVAMETRLLSRVPFNVSRKIVRSVRVVLMYVWNGKYRGEGETTELPAMDWEGVKTVIRNKIPL